MKCPPAGDWDLLASEALEADQAQPLLAHARTCSACRACFEAARRAHIDRVRTYEAFDQKHDELREQLMAALPDELPRRSDAGGLARGWARLGDVIMSMNKSASRRATAVLVPAACVLAAVGLLLASSEKSAFAAAIEHLRQAKTIVCRITTPDGIESQGVKMQLEGKLYISEQHGARSDVFLNDTPVAQHFAPPTGPLLLVQAPTRTYMEITPDDADEMSAAERNPDAWVQRLRGLTDEQAGTLGERTFDGHEAVGFKIPGEKLGYASTGSPERDAYGELWVDTETRLPVRFVMSMPVPAPGERVTLVFDQFEWDVPLEADLFKPQIDESFTKLDLQLTRPTEEALLNTLKEVSDLTGGRYTSTLEPASMMVELTTMLAESSKDLVRDMDHQGMMEFGIKIIAGGQYYQKLVREGHDPEYFGGDVTAADADQILLRWKLDNGQTRVIYGDLRIETLPVEE